MMRVVRAAGALLHQAMDAGRVVRGRLYNVLPIDLYLKGAYSSFEEAEAHAPKGALGYDHVEVVEHYLDVMCRVLSWDYPVLFWLARILPGARTLIDAGGHIGTKYRAFANALDYKPDLHWAVLELPAAVAEGRRRAAAEGLVNLRFETDPHNLPKGEVLLASGFMQYYPHELSTLLRALPELPEHVLVNKIAVRDGPRVFSLQKIGPSRVPYQIRNKRAFLNDVKSLGYELVDEWDIPILAHVIPTHPELGSSQSLGFYFRRKTATTH